MTKKIIVFSTDDFTPPAGGAELAIQYITERLPEFEFDLVCANIYRKDKFEKVNNVNIYRIGIGIPQIDKFILMFFGHLKGMQLQKTEKYSAVWGMMASYGGFAAMFFKKKNPEVPFLLTLQEGDDLSNYKKKLGILYGTFLKIFSSADYTQCISNYLAKWAKENGATCPIEIVPNGANIAHFSQNYPEQELLELKNKLGKKENDKFVITTSRLVFKNAVGDVIKALPFLPLEVKFLVLGVGPDENKLRGLVAELKLENRVLFLGNIEHKDMPKYLKISDIFIRPSISEGLGNSFIEAMAAGLPTIGTPVGGIPDFLIEGETGFLCQPNDPQSIADTINRILNLDKARLDQIKKNASRLVSEKFNWEVVGASMRRIFLAITK